MILFKPAQVSLLTRPLEYRGRFGLSISALLHLPMAQPPQGNLWGEQSLWAFVGQAGMSAVLDEAVVKMQPEYLVHGSVHAHPPGARACAARVALGASSKTLLAFAPRHWNGTRIQDDQPFSPVPLRWSEAYGGPDFAANPEGTGRAARDGVRWLPRLELPGSRLTAPDQAVVPAGLGPLDMMHPQRAALRGTYDDNYLKTHAPGLPPDTDWRHFNRAPQDQWLAQALHGDERYALDNLHPTRPRIEGRLPGLRVRVLVDHGRPDGEPRLKEVPLRLTTVWFFPEAERLVLCWHGLAEVARDDATDISRLLAAVERLSEPRPVEHYVDAMARRSDPRDGGLESLVDTDLLPDGIDTTDPAAEAEAAVFKMEGLQAEAQYRRAQLDMELAREKLRAQGKDPDAMGVRLPPREKPPTLAELPAHLKAQGKRLQQQQWAALDDALKLAEKVHEMARQRPLRLADIAHRGPPAYRADAHLRELTAQFAQAGKALNTDALGPRLQKKEAMDRVSYLQSAHLQPPVDPLTGEAAARRRNEMLWLLSRGVRAQPNMDWTGADLSGLDLRGLDLSGAWLESANLSGTNLSGAQLTGAVLAHANLSGCLLIDATLVGANLGGAHLAGAVFDQSDLSGATLSRCTLAQTQCRKIRLPAAQLMETTWGPADWTGAELPGTTFYKLDLRGVVLAEAQLAGALFIECQLGGVDLRAANLEGASFVASVLDGASLAGARLVSAVFAKGCSMRDADASQADLSRANLGDSVASGLRLVKARLDGACLGEADLRGCDLRLGAAKGALLRKSRLQGARLAGANLHDAVLAHADLRGADLRGSNLFGADLSRVWLNDQTRFDGALTTRARTWPRWSAEQQAVGPPEA